MSLINQMLKDLEKRSKLSEDAIPILGLRSAALKMKNHRKWYGLLAISTAFALLFLWKWAHFPLPSFSFHHATPVVEEIGKEEKKIIPIEKASAISVTGVSLEIQGEMTNLRFLLNQEAHYRLSTDPQNNLLNIIIEHAQFATGLPLIDNLHGAIKNISILNQNKDELVISIWLQPQAELKRLELHKEGKFPELQMDLALKNLPAAAPEVRTDTIKRAALNLNADEEYQAALEWIEKGQAQKAAQQLLDIIEKFPAFSAARESLVSLLLQEGEFDKADELLTRGLAQQPYFPAFVQLKARLLTHEGNPGEALHLLLKAPPTLADHTDYYALIAALYQQLGKFSEAAQLYEQLTELQPGKGAWWVGLGAAFEGMEKSSQAQEAYAAANKREDLSPELKAFVGAKLT